MKTEEYIVKNENLYTKLIQDSDEYVYISLFDNVIYVTDFEKCTESTKITFTKFIELIEETCQGATELWILYDKYIKFRIGFGNLGKGEYIEYCTMNANLGFILPRNIRKTLKKLEIEKLWCSVVAIYYCN